MESFEDLDAESLLGGGGESVGVDGGVVGWVGAGETDCAFGDDGEDGGGEGDVGGHCVLGSTGRGEPFDFRVVVRVGGEVVEGGLVQRVSVGRG